MNIDGGDYINLSNRVAIVPHGFFVETADGVPVFWARNTSSTVARYPEINITNYGGNTAGFPILTLYNVLGTVDAPQAAINGYKLGAIIAQSHDGTQYASGARIDFDASGAWTPASHGADIIFSTLGAGEIGIPKERMRIKTGGNLSFTPPIAITGSRSDGTALTNLLAQLSARGIIVDQTTP